MVLLPPFIHWNQQKDFWLTARSNAQHPDSLSPRQTLNGLAAFYKLNDREVRPATLQLILNDKDLQELAAKRNDALAQGFLTSKHKQQLPALLNVKGRRMNASVRLRGNQPDHLSGQQVVIENKLKARCQV